MSVPQLQNSHGEIFELPSQNQRELATAADLALGRLRRLTNHHRPSDLLPLPTCPACVLHKIQPISCGEATILQTSHNRERLWQYMIERHKWTKRTAAYVNINALRAARNKNPSLHRFTTCLLQGHLPTRHRLHQQGKTTSNLCPRCQNEETHNHMFQCSHREEWRTFLECLNDHLDGNETDPAVREEIFECTRARLNGTQPDLENRCHQLDVGIHLLHRGLLGIDWSYRQQAHYDATIRPHSGHHWVRNLILFLWDEAHELWTLRNNKTHEPNEELQRQDLVHEVEEVYGLKPLTLAQDRDNFNIPLSTRLTHTTQQPHNFIQSQSQGNLIRFSVREAARLTETLFQPIRNFSPRR